MAVVMGVDGARGGWLAVRRDTARGTAEVAAATQWEALPPADVVCVDMPIGLPDSGRRGCDMAARALLGPRRASVFLDLRRPLLGFADYAQALAWAKADGNGISKQAWNIVPRIVELDRALGPADQDRVFETHPELAFRTLNGDAALDHGKRSAAGAAARRGLLEAAGYDRLDAWLAALDRRHAVPDDLLDACALALCAARIHAGRGRRLPDGEPLRDARGLRMEIWY